MTQPVPIAILLFIVAFLVGFFLIYLWRAGSFARKYKEEIDELTAERALQQQRVEDARDKNFHIQSQYARIHQELEEKEALHERLRSREATLMEKISALENEKEELEEKIREEESETLKVRSEIEQLTKELAEVDAVQARLDQNAQRLSELEQKLADHKALKQSYLEEIEKLKTLRKKFREEAKMLEEKLFDTKALLFNVEKEISAIEKRFAPKIDLLQKQSEALKIKALNYKFALKEYLEHYGEEPLRIKEPMIQKLFKMPRNKAEEIASLIDKNETAGILERVKQKLFKKKLSQEEH